MAAMSPWGQIDYVEKYELGLCSVGTPSHGGLRVSRGYANKHLSQAAIRTAIEYGGYYWFEEDCDWCIVASETPHLWPAFFACMKNVDPAEYLEQSLRRWNAKYLLDLADER